MTCQKLREAMELSSSESSRGMNLRPSLGGERLRLGSAKPLFEGISVVAGLNRCVLVYVSKRHGG